MAHEILSVKLCQLDERMSRLHSRIHMSETASHSQLCREIDDLKQECREKEMELRDTLWRSKSELVSILAQSYDKMEQIIQNTRAQLNGLAEDNPDADFATEKDILLAEYALDFAHRAADRALLLSMEAIEAQLAKQEKEGSTL